MTNFQKDRGPSQGLATSTPRSWSKLWN